MSRRLRWGVVVLVALALLSLAIARALNARRSAAAVAVTAAEVKVQAVEIAATDLARATFTEISATVPVSGGLKAVNSAFVKAKVAAEVAQLPVREGDRVEAGQLLGRLDATEFQWRLRQAEDQAAAAEAQLEIADKTLANNRALVDQGFISRNALDTSLASANGARASLQAARAAAEIARKSVRDTELRAPLAGLVAQRLAQPGERVAVDARLVEIVDLSRLELEAAVAPEDVVSLRVGQAATLWVDGLATPLRATVARINPGTQGGTRSVLAYLSVQAAPALRQGLFARGSVESLRKRALAVPLAVMRSDSSRPSVLTVEGNRVAVRELQTGLRGEVDFGQGPEPAVEVLAGLSEGAQLLRGTVGSLPAGTTVVLPAAQAQPGAPARAAASAASGANP